MQINKCVQSAAAGMELRARKQRGKDYERRIYQGCGMYTECAGGGL